METGKVEFAPDYKSDFESGIRQGQSVAEAMMSANDKAVERSRLEREVIEKAKEFTSNEVKENWDALVAYRKLCGAVDALIEFESSQLQIKK